MIAQCLALEFQTAPFQICAQPIKAAKTRRGHHEDALGLSTTLPVLLPSPLAEGTCHQMSNAIAIM